MKMLRNWAFSPFLAYHWRWQWAKWPRNNIRIPHNFFQPLLTILLLICNTLTNISGFQVSDILYFPLKIFRLCSLSSQDQWPMGLWWETQITCTPTGSLGKKTDTHQNETDRKKSIILCRSINPPQKKPHRTSHSYLQGWVFPLYVVYWWF